jgi:hypothetical protein
MILEKEAQFWANEGKVIKISNAKLLKFLELNGFMQVKQSPTSYLLVRKEDNKIRMSSEDEMIMFVSGYLLRNRHNDVYEVFVRGVGNYFSAKKRNFLPAVDLPNDRDTRDQGIFYFNNCYCEITKDETTIKSYDELPNVIWKNRIIDYEYNYKPTSEVGQFEQFCRNITNDDSKRFLTLKTILGYLLHRNKERGETTAIILYDENMTLSSETHGGTGKTLLTDAISKVRELIQFDGKSIKKESWFKNQRIEVTTDLLVYDDLNKVTSLELFYSMLTTGIEIEKKRQDAIYIPFERSPKITITSNYPVKGPGGSSDKRRRFEFEIFNYYDEVFTPEADFGNRFFGRDWSEYEWNKFYEFLIDCLKEYLEKGLVKSPKIKLDKNRLLNETCSEFIEFADKNFESDRFLDKRTLERLFSKYYPNIDMTPHMFYKWCKIWCAEKGFLLKKENKGGVYTIKFLKKDDEVDNITKEVV